MALGPLFNFQEDRDHDGHVDLVRVVERAAISNRKA